MPAVSDTDGHPTEAVRARCSPAAARCHARILGAVKVAITGSHGLIGTALGESLRASGDIVVSVPRGPAGLDVSVLRGCDAVVHLAGAGIGDKRWTPARKQEVIRSRTETTAAVAEACAHPDGPKVLLSGSAVGFYGDRGDELLTESSASGELFLSEICRAWEAAAEPAVSAGDVRVAFLRTGMVLSPAGGALGKLRPLFRFGLGGRLGPGDQWLSCISLSDEVGAIRWLLDGGGSDVAGPVNLVGPEPTTNAVFTKTYGRVLHRPTPLPIPRFGPAALLGRELAHELLFVSERVDCAVLREHGYEFRHPTLESALQYAS